MKTTRTLALAALAALSLGVGSAMAQDGGQAYPDCSDASEWSAPAGSRRARRCRGTVGFV